MTDIENKEWQKLTEASQNLLLYCSFIAAGCFGYSSATKTSIKATLQLAFNLAGGAYLTAKYSSIPIDNFTKALYPYTSQMYPDKEMLKYQTLSVRYEKIKTYISEHNRQILDSYFAMYKAWIYATDGFELKNIIIRNISSFLEYTFTILEKPTKDNKHKYTKQDIDDKSKQLLDLLATYPQQRDAILKFAKSVAFYQLRDEEDYKNIRALCLEGPPGVGKTKLIESLCEIYGVNLVILKGKNTVGEGGWERSFYDDLQPSKAHPLVQAMYKSSKLGFSGYTMVFFDEIDKLPHGANANSNYLPTLEEVAQLLLEIMDNDRETIRDGYSGMDFPKNKILLAIAVNESILDRIPGLERRVDVIKFDKIKPETKQEIALKKLQTFCEDNKLSISDELITTVTTMANNNHEDGVGELIEDIRSLVYELSQNDFYANTILADDKKAILTRYESIIAEDQQVPEQTIPVNTPTLDLPGPILT